MGLLALETSAGEVQARRWRTDPAKRLTAAIDELHKRSKETDRVVARDYCSTTIPMASNCDLGLGEEGTRGIDGSPRPKQGAFPRTIFCLR